MSDKADDQAIVAAFNLDIENTAREIAAKPTRDDLYAPWGGKFSEKTSDAFPVLTIAKA